MNLTQMPKDGERVSLGATLIAKQYAYAVDESVSMKFTSFYRITLQFCHVHLQICVSDHRIYCEEYPT